MCPRHRRGGRGRQVGKKQAANKVWESANEKLISMMGGFSHKTAISWLREKFPSFETAQECPIGLEGKSEPDYFSSATRLGFVAKLPETAGADAVNRPLLVAAVEMKGIITERTSRNVQFNFAKRVLRDAVNQGATGLSGLPSQGLFFFHDQNGNFRLSLVTGEVDGKKFKFNEAKRQSFYIEPNARNNIVRRRFYEDIKTFTDLKDVFSVEKLTKEFYKRLFDWYNWAMESETNVHFPNDLADRADDRKYNNEAIIRLITRLMFTWFIRQKNLVPSELFDKEALGDILKKFNPDSMDEDNYYRAILQNLFFATFNTPQDGGGKIARRWINADTDENGNGMGLSGDYNVATVYRYRNEFRNPDSFIALMKKVPFLNCALFDCLDKIEDKEDGGRKLYFDGFSTRAKRQAHVPNGLFFGNGDEGRLGIISLFSEYEFTIDENDADDADVSLDPELLGKVFENLLGAFNPETQETARKATGSFYTPREIVDYMVEESLKSYLRGKLGRDGLCPVRGRAEVRPSQQIPDLDAKLDNLFDKAKTAERAPTGFSRDEEKAILDALYSAKIIDPACGSGAFPMGVLHCMIRLMKRLDPDSTSIRAHLLARYKADKAANDPAETAEERKDRLAELERRLEEGQHYPDYERKLYLIENCIYGVDIQPIAAQISKLRFFISLLCDQFRTSYDLEKENYGLLSLPNLEAKFVCGNTLISLPDTGSELDLTVGDVHRLREELVRNRHRLFGARSTKTKEKYKARDKEIRHAIKAAVVSGLAKPDEKKIAIWEAQIEKAQKERKKIEMPDWQEIAKPVQSDFFAETTVQPMLMKIDRNADKRDAIDREIKGLERSIEKERDKASKANVSAAQDYAKLVSGWDPFDQNASSSFFDPKWMFNIADGFDVVIGNPPYVQLQGKLATQYGNEGFEVYEKTGDMYCLFYEQGRRLLSDKGNVCLITSNKWMRVNYGRSLRRFLLARCQPVLLLDFAAEQIFDAATVDTNILQFVKKSEGSFKQIIACAATAECRDSIRSFVKKNAFKIDFDNDEPWAIVSPAVRKVKAHIEAVGHPLGTLDVSINYGIKTGLNKVFIVDDALMRQLIYEDNSAREILYPILLGRDIKRYQHQPHSWLIGTHNGQKDIGLKRVVISKYPSVKRYLDKFKSALEDRSDQGDTPYNLRDCAYWDSFRHTKIVWAELARSGNAFSLDEMGCYVETSGFTLTIPDDDIARLKFLLAILNSKLMLFYLDIICSKLDATGWRWKRQFVERLPIVAYSFGSPLVEKVDKVLSIKRADPAADTSAYEAEIDQLVYKLYGLTDEEIEVVEGRKVDDGEGGGVLKQKDARERVPPSGALRTTRPTRRLDDDDEMLD